MDPKRQDVLDSILDSMSVDDTMEKKINEFAETKQRRKRIERARENSEQFNQTYSSKPAEESAPRHASKDQLQKEETDSLEIPGFANGNASNFTHTQPSATQTITSLPSSEAAVSEMGATMVFPGSQAASADEDEPSSQTVVMSDQEIQNLLDEDEPLLKREYVDNGSLAGYSNQSAPRQRAYAPQPAPAKVNWKVPAIIVGCVLGALFLFGGYQLISGYIQEKTSETAKQSKEAYDKVLAWVNDYDNLSDADKAKITSLESYFNKLDQTQKSKINEQLKAKTGKTFDQLLALAKAGEKKDSSNNNTKVAEQKAKLKDQIQTLQSQKDGLQASLTTVQNNINAANQDYQAKSQVYSDASNAYNSANQRLGDLQNQLNNLGNRNFDSEIAGLNADLAKEEARQPSETATPEEKQNFEIEKQKNIDKINSDIQTVRDQMTQYNSTRDYLNGEIGSLQGQIPGLKSAMDSAQQDMNSAKSAYDAVQGSDESLVKQISDTQAQIDSLQKQLDELD